MKSVKFITKYWQITNSVLTKSPLSLMFSHSTLGKYILNMKSQRNECRIIDLSITNSSRRFSTFCTWIILALFITKSGLNYSQISKFSTQLSISLTSSVIVAVQLQTLILWKLLCFLYFYVSCSRFVFTTQS